jgi:imidazolonepropionase-like amidohydrolase
MRVETKRRRHGETKCSSRCTRIASTLLVVVLLGAPAASAQIAIKAKTLHTMGPAGKISDGVVVLKDGKVAAIGPVATTAVPDGFKTIEGAVVTPGLIDAHSTVGLSGIYNQPHDSDQLERSSPIQPELRALDAYNPREQLIEWVRSFGITTLHTGHAPGELISGQTIIVKTIGNTVEEALVREPGAIAATLSPSAHKDGAKSPGTRGKSMAMLRAELIKTQEYVKKREAAATKPAEPKDAAGGKDQSSERNLRYDALARVLKGEIPLMITANRVQDIDSVLRLADEFRIRVWLDMASEAYELLPAIKAANMPVIVHPTMYRAWGDTENLSMETASKLRKAGIPFALQSGYESYVPKTRVVLFEAAVAAANGLSFDEALASITIDAAKILGVDKRVGSLELGKDGDVALYDGDPFEYTTHCVGTVIDGKLVSEIKR